MPDLDFARELELFTGPDAIAMLWAATTGTTDAPPPDLSGELIDLHYRPGAETTALYEVRVGDAVEFFGATTADVGGQVATLTGDGLTVRVWRHPADPRLPGLVGACDPDTVGAWLDALQPSDWDATTLADCPSEMPPSGSSAPISPGDWEVQTLAPPETSISDPTVPIPPPGDWEVQTLAYRPLRRAVLRADQGDVTYFIKVVRPDRVEPLALRHRLIANAGLGVPVVARPAPGVLITPELVGRPLSDHLTTGDVPSLAELVAALGRLPAEALDLPVRPGWPDILDFHTNTAVQQLPDEDRRIRDVAGVIASVLASAPTGPLMPVHGDFYEANIFVTPDGLRFIDVDSVGPGLLEDELACLIGHGWVLPAYDEQFADVGRVLASWQADAERLVDPAALRSRVAAVALSLVAGADDAQARARLALAERFAASAR